MRNAFGNTERMPGECLGNAWGMPEEMIGEGSVYS